MILVNGAWFRAHDALFIFMLLHPREKMQLPFSKVFHCFFMFFGFGKSDMDRIDLAMMDAHSTFPDTEGINPRW